jgi:hypothetical protein
MFLRNSMGPARPTNCSTSIGTSGVFRHKPQREFADHANSNPGQNINLKYAKQFKYYGNNDDHPDNVEDVFVHVGSPAHSLSHIALKCSFAKPGKRALDGGGEALDGEAVAGGVGVE